MDAHDRLAASALLDVQPDAVDADLGHARTLPPGRRPVNRPHAGRRRPYSVPDRGGGDERRGQPITRAAVLRPGVEPGQRRGRERGLRAGLRAPRPPTDGGASRRPGSGEDRGRLPCGVPRPADGGGSAARAGGPRRGALDDRGHEHRRVGGSPAHRQPRDLQRREHLPDPRRQGRRAVEPSRRPRTRAAARRRDLRGRRAHRGSTRIPAREFGAAAPSDGPSSPRRRSGPTRRACPGGTSPATTGRARRPPRTARPGRSSAPRDAAR